MEATKHREEKTDDTIYVTDLVKCPARVYYEREHPEIAVASSINPSTLLGDIAHKGLKEYFTAIAQAHNASVEYEAEAEKQVSINNTTFKVKGRADAILTVNGEKILVEFKTAKADKGIPYEHHKQQLRLYLWLFNAQKGVLLYITPDRIAEYHVNNPARDDEVARLVAETINKSRNPRYNWECTYCPYAFICPYRPNKE